MDTDQLIANGSNIIPKYICWEIDNFVIKSDISKRFFICIKNILKKLSCYHDNYLDTSCSENTMVLSQGEGFCMHVFYSSRLDIASLGVKSEAKLYMRKSLPGTTE